MATLKHNNQLVNTPRYNTSLEHLKTSMVKTLRCNTSLEHLKTSMPLQRRFSKGREHFRARKMKKMKTTEYEPNAIVQAVKSRKETRKEKTDEYGLLRYTKPTTDSCSQHWLR
ncbi:hypothetical protein FHG87_021366 [Trinorchestia longiramus]|nr:hypothetical protein FHG87_021366 [Trinorchestia longiramus]